SAGLAGSVEGGPATVQWATRPAAAISGSACVPVTSEATADMANNPKKLSDPADEAMTAIQQVLSVPDEPGADQPINSPEPERPVAEPSHSAYSAPSQPAAERSSFGRPAADKDLFQFEPGASDDVRPTSQFAANDDRQTIGQILQTLQQRPSKTSYVVATLFAVAWAACGVVLAFLYLPDLQAALKAGSAGLPPVVGLGGLLLGPIVFFYLVAFLMWRS